MLGHLRGIATLREQVQTLLHLNPAQSAHAPLARSTWSDALAESSRLAALKGALRMLNAHAEATLPDRLAGIPGLGAREVGVFDVIYQHESGHFRKRTPKQGGEENDKGMRC